MRKFIFKLVLFIFPFLVGFIFIEKKLAEIPNSYNLKRKYFEKQIDSIEVLTLGSSQALYSIDPSFFSFKGFNLANVSQSIFYDKSLVLSYLPRLKKLKVVIIPLSYFSFYYQLNDSKEEWRDYYYYHFWDVRYKTLNWFDARNYFLTSVYSVSKVKDFAKKSFNVNLADGLSINGFMKKDTLNNVTRISDSTGIKRVSLHNKSMHSYYLAENINDLEILIDKLKQCDVKVVLLSTPVFATYSKYCDVKILFENKKIINTLSMKYNCKYYSYFTDKRFDAGDFYDNDHMNYKGAERFTKIINEEILIPLFNSSRPN